MEVTPGYKQTDVGVIPEDWEVEPLGELSDFVTSGSRGWAQFYSESGALFIRSQNVRDGRLSFEDVQYVSAPTGAEGNRTKIKLNDLLITITGNSVGNVALVEQSFDEAYISQHVGLVRLKEPNVGAYVCRYLSPNSPGNPQIAASQSGQSKPGLNLQNLRGFHIALPPTSNELHAIANALSDVDALLDALDRLIAKKRDLKQATMQRLLTAQTRLPGFSGEWEVKTIGDVIEKIVGGGTPSRVNPAFWGNEISWATVKDFATFSPHHTQESITRTGLKNSASNLIPAGTLITSTRMALGKAVIYEVDVAINQDLKGLFLNGEAIVRFLYYWFGHFGRKLDDLGSGSTVKGISIGGLKNLRFYAPRPPEQIAIAAVLSDMDAEIDTIEARRAKTRDLKQAMMQELLTGKTRLVQPEAARA